MEQTNGVLKTKQRQVGPDVVRIVACFLVVSVHFFYNNGFYYEPVAGDRMFIMVVMRSFFMVCVPLFLMLTGCLMRNQKLSASYYLKGVKTYVIYLLASTACMLFRIYYGKESREILWGYLTFRGAPYGWYIEMYLGLFVLIPFLNILYNGIPSKKGKLALIATMLFLTSLPAILNAYNFNVPGWWAQPSSSAAYQKLLPSWWMGIYPLTYYFIGAYIGEHKPKMRVPLNLSLLGISVIASGLYNFWRSRNEKFIWGTWSDYTSLLTVAMAVLTFILLVNISGKKLPSPAKTALGIVSQLTLGAYLLSYIYDTLFYKTLIERVPVMTDRLPLYFQIVPAVFVCSLASSFVLEVLYMLLRLAAGRIYIKIKTPAPAKSEQ